MMDKSKTPRHKVGERHDPKWIGGVLDSSIVQGAFSVAPCQTLISRFATFSSSQGRALMEPYLPRGTSPSVSPYSEGGALYALGLIHVDHGEGIQQVRERSLRVTLRARWVTLRARWVTLRDRWV
jgi:hypothetical protein